VLCIGYSPYLVKAVIDDIEPNGTIGILAIPDSQSKLLQKLPVIQEILKGDIDQWISCPISDLEYIFRTYAEIISNSIHEKDILFLSLGPKIFTVASILVSQRFDSLTCLYLKYPKSKAKDIQADGTTILSKISYSFESEVVL
jgi:hypothetical protein